MISTNHSPPITASKGVCMLLKLNKILFLIIVLSIIVIFISLFVGLCKIIYYIIVIIFNLFIKRNKKIIGECCICLEPITEDNKITTECNHTFHDKCIAKMYDYNINNNRCPLCRRSI